MFSVYATLYGDYPSLASKLLAGFSYHKHVCEYVFGLNQISDATRKVLQDWIDVARWRAGVTTVEDSERRNLGKYPLMRQMLQLNARTSNVMWFDDDSYVDPVYDGLWWEKIVDHWNQRPRNAVQCGAIHKIRQRGRQYEVIAKQPWYTGKPLTAVSQYTFVTGGWWIADRSFLAQWDYPFPALHHNGGDSILGELARQQNQQLIGAGPWARCHCESCSRRPAPPAGPMVHINVGGRAGRRGIGMTNERYVWADGNPEPSLAHQEFTMEVREYNV